MDYNVYNNGGQQQIKDPSLYSLACGSSRSFWSSWDMICMIWGVWIFLHEKLVENLDDIKKDVQGNEEQHLKPLDATKCFHSCHLGLEPAHGLYLEW